MKTIARLKKQFAVVLDHLFYEYALLLDRLMVDQSIVCNRPKQARPFLLNLVKRLYLKILPDFCSSFSSSSDKSS